MLTRGFDQAQRRHPPLTPTPPPAAHVNTAFLPNIGDTVGGHCVLTALLGEGAFGRVFAAEHVETKQQLALKIVGLSRYPREYAEHELSALAAIMHPNVVQLNEYGVEVGAPEPFLWYTMPLYRGQDLASLLETRGPLPLRAAHGIFARIAGGVCEMHDSGLRHQDIKPENIYLARMTGVDDHHPVLLDLGGAAREGSTSPLIATLGFAAPEQSDALLGMQLGERRRVELCGKIDVYALAATLLYALLGKSEFRGYDIGQREGDDVESSGGLEKLRQELWAVQEAREARPLPAGTFPEMSRAERQRLNDAFRGWLTRDPEARPDARTLLRELSVLLEWDKALARAAERSRRRRAVLAVTAGSAVAAGAGGLAGYQWHRYAMSRAEEVAQAALRGRDEAASALRRADDVLDGIVSDATLGPAEKARKIGVVIESLRAQASRLVDSNHELKTKLDELERARQSLEQSRDRALRERKSALDARVEALSAARAAEEAKARADAERERALVEKLLSESAKARADTEREQAVRERRAAERNRAEAEAERDRAVRERRTLEEAKARVEDERDTARAEQKAAEEAGFARGLAAGSQPKAPDPPPDS